jgi:hypothetical protein
MNLPLNVTDTSKLISIIVNSNEGEIILEAIRISSDGEMASIPHLRNIRACAKHVCSKNMQADYSYKDHVPTYIAFFFGRLSNIEPNNNVDITTFGVGCSQAHGRSLPASSS